jgi:hypothetical protein
MRTSKSYPKQAFKQLSHRIVPLVLQRHNRNHRSRSASCSSSLRPGSAPGDDDGGEEEEGIGEAADEPPHNRKSHTNGSSSFLSRAVGGRVQSLVLVLITSGRWKSGKRRSSPSSRCVLGPAFPDPSAQWYLCGLTAYRSANRRRIQKAGFNGGLHAIHRRTSGAEKFG